MPSMNTHKEILQLNWKTSLSYRENSLKVVDFFFEKNTQ